RPVPCRSCNKTGKKLGQPPTAPTPRTLTPNTPVRGRLLHFPLFVVQACRLYGSRRRAACTTEGDCEAIGRRSLPRGRRAPPTAGLVSGQAWQAGPTGNPSVVRIMRWGRYLLGRDLSRGELHQAPLFARNRDSYTGQRACEAK